MDTEDLIARLAARARPVRRVPPPMISLLVWLVTAAVVIGAVVAAFGLRHDLPERLATGVDLPQMLLAGVTGVAAGLASFHLALPDRDPRWAWLPVPPALGWIATMGWGCIADAAASGWGALVPGVSLPCLAFILALGVPLSVFGGLLARHAAGFRPAPVAALIGLSAASFASIGLTLVHHLDAAMTVLVWHGLAVVAVTLGATLFGPRAMAAAG
jgi:hypothetical protein